MPVTRVTLTETDIEILKKRKKRNSNTRISILVVSLLIFFISNFYSSNENFKYVKVFFIIIILLLFLSSLFDVNLYNDLSEKEKFVGLVKVKEKEYRLDSEDNTEIHFIIFDEWRIGNIQFKKEYWDRINKGDEFYIEQTTNSDYILGLSKENIDFTEGIIRWK